MPEKELKKPNERRKRGRPRDPANDAAILKAAREILSTEGFDALTFEAISRKTGISRVSIYRRWPNKYHLASYIANRDDVLVEDVLSEQGLEAQISTFLNRLYSHYDREDVRGATLGALMAWQRDPSIRETTNREIEQAARAAFGKIVERGIGDGQIRATVDSDALFDVLIGPIMYSKMFSSMPERGPNVDSIKDIIMDGIKPEKTRS